MAEDKELANAVKQVPTLIDEVRALGKKLFGKEKFAEIKIGEKSYSYTGVETFGIGAEMKDCPDGDYQTETHSFTVKAGKVTDYKEKEKAATPDFANELKAQAEAYEVKLAAQKTDFDNQIKALGEKFTSTVSDLVNGKLKEMFDLIEKIAGSASVESTFKKKDGEPAAPQNGTAFERAKKEAALMSKKVFN